MRYVYSLVTLIGAAGLAHASLVYQLTPAVYAATPGGTIQTFATVTNTGPEVLYYAFGFVDPGTVPAAGVTGQLPPLVLQPGDRVYFTAAAIKTAPGTDTGTYTFTEGVGYHPGLDVSGTVEASDSGILLVVPEPASLMLFCSALIAAIPVLLFRVARR